METGTCAGGSAYYLASLCDAIGSGRVITIDIKPPKRPPQHDRITYLTGSSIDPEIAAAVRQSIEPDDRVMVILDSAHSDRHVLQEMGTYGPLVTPGSYLIVEDTNLGDNPIPRAVIFAASIRMLLGTEQAARAGRGLSAGWGVSAAGPSSG